ncbi:MAG: 23S rRNA (uracil(1939)-C(5))-methyltransferase RlmD [Lachnospiraceae bacterium]|jgi:23S rRNA (uracil1939-C5)-methyltransferase
MLKKNQESVGYVYKVDYPNRGRIIGGEGERITVKNVIPGQKVKFRIIKRKGEKMQGNLVEVVEKASLEEDKKCDVFPYCGGCLYQTLPYEEQLKLKSGQIRELFSDIVDENTVFEGIIPSPEPFEYRNKMEFTFGDDRINGPLRLGLHKKNSSYDILMADSCKIVHRDVTKVLRCVFDYCEEKGFKHYHRVRHDGFLRHLLIRRSHSGGELLVCLVTTSAVEHDFRELADKLINLDIEGSFAGIVHGINDLPADMVQYQTSEILYGKDYFYEELLGLKFKVSMFSFFQTNTAGAEKLYEKAREYIAPEGKKYSVVYDLYSGTGTIGQMMAPAARKVYGIEIIQEAVDAANENRILNNIENCEFLCGDVGKTLDKIPERPDFLILDPPREGILPKTLEQIMSFDVSKMVYISCKASSFVQDMNTMAKYGWRIEKYALVDMFPHTQHVETVCLMSRKEK